MTLGCLQNKTGIILFITLRKTFERRCKLFKERQAYYHRDCVYAEDDETYKPQNK